MPAGEAAARRYSKSAEIIDDSDYLQNAGTNRTLRRVKSVTVECYDHLFSESEISYSNSTMEAADKQLTGRSLRRLAPSSSLKILLPPVEPQEIINESSNEQEISFEYSNSDQEVEPRETCAPTAESAESTESKGGSSSSPLNNSNTSTECQQNFPFMDKPDDSILGGDRREDAVYKPFTHSTTKQSFDSGVYGELQTQHSTDFSDIKQTADPNGTSSSSSSCTESTGRHPSATEYVSDVRVTMQCLTDSYDGIHGGNNAAGCNSDPATTPPSHTRTPQVKEFDESREHSGSRPHVAQCGKETKESMVDSL